MNNPIRLLAVLALAALTACARATVFGHTVKDDPAPAASAPTAPAQVSQPPITRLLIDYTPAAEKQTADDANFSGKGFSKVVGDGLAARGLADLANSAVVRVAAIEVDEFDVRATSNVILMGHVASSGVLGGKVRIRDGSGTQLREFHVRAQVPLKIARNRKEANQLDGLYREFAALMADELTGTVRMPKPVTQRQ